MLSPSSPEALTDRSSERSGRKSETLSPVRQALCPLSLKKSLWPREQAPGTGSLVLSITVALVPSRVQRIASTAGSPS